MSTYIDNIDLHQIFTTFKKQWQILDQKWKCMYFLVELTEIQFAVPKFRDLGF